MGSIHATRPEWEGALKQLDVELKQVSGLKQTIPDERTFQDKYIALLEEHEVSDPVGEYGMFGRNYQSMIFFVRVIDANIALTSPNSLNDLFWTTTFCAIATILEAGYEYADFLKLFERLNDALQLDQNELSKYEKNSKVQACLQRIFQAYIGSYLKFKRQANEDERRDDEINFAPIESEREEAIRTIEAAVADWTEQVSEAEKDAQRAGEPDIQWEQLSELGSGTYGTVWKVREVGTGSVYARKSIPRSIAGTDDESIERRVRNEVSIMRKLQHSHIANINILLKGEANWDIIMLPVADCNLRVYLEEKCVKAKYPSDALKRIEPWFGCLISALTFAHTKQIKHEDIKLTNVLVKGETVYLTDFGTAKDFSDLEASTAGNFYEQGTPIYWAPEGRPWGRAADVFAMGCLFAEMLTVRQKRSLTDFKRFRGAETGEWRFAFKSNLPKVREWMKDKLNVSRNSAYGTLCEQILNMLIEDPEDRPDARRVKKNLRGEETLFCETCG